MMKTPTPVFRNCAKTLAGALMACWLIGAQTASAQWAENFDSYANGSHVIGQGEWQGWDGDTTVSGVVTNAFAYSRPNSLRIFGTALTPGNYCDTVHSYSGYTSGQWVFSAEQYIPTGATGTSYFILLDNYDNGGANKNWAIQTHFDLDAGTLTEDMGTSQTLPVIRDQWVELRYEIDLAANTVSAFYNGQLLSTHVWSTGDNALSEIQAIDLYSDVSGPVFYDNISLKRAPIVVNTLDNTDFSAGKTNLVTAINLLQDGDTIHFNIPGDGPFYLATPPFVPNNGYPAITANNVTIDGYSQPGASPNTNPILAANNAKIMIVIDSRAGGRHMEDIDGYGTGESAALFVVGASNVTIRGLCFLGPGPGAGDPSDPANYGISYALDADYGHINGCWFGVDLDGTNVYPFADAVTGFQGPSGTYIDGTVIGVEKDAPDAAAARAQFNVNIGQFIPIILEGSSYRIAGNFMNVFPDGVTDFNINGVAPHEMEAFIEIGRSGDNLVLGTDGDGVNDAEERNIFGGTTALGDDNIIEWYGGSRTNMVIAGNYFGMAVDGITRFTNSMKLFDSFNSTTTVRVGSDFDGVSDSVEGNVIAMNYPFDTLFPDPVLAGSQLPVFAAVDRGARLSLRGNELIGNNIPPISWASLSDMNTLTNIYTNFMTVSALLPALSTNSSNARLQGTCDVGLAPYTNVFIDFYTLDPESWTNGQKFLFSALFYLEPGTGNVKYYGFPQGKTYLGSFLVDGPQDLDPADGSFDFDIGGLNLPGGTEVTVAASYSADPAGTHNGRTMTTPFAMPVALASVPRVNISLSGTDSIMLSWPQSDGMFTIESTSSLSPPSWSPLSPQPPITPVGSDYQATVPVGSGPAFFRLAQ